MPRRLKETPIASKADRRKLKPGTYWRALDRDIHLGFRKTSVGSAGVWLVRWYKGGQKYWHHEFATTDDVANANGAHVLDYDMARTACIALVDGAKAKHFAEVAGPAATVKSAVAAYVDDLTKRQAESGAEPRKGAEGNLKRHVLADKELAELPLYELTAERLDEWKKGLAALQPSGIKYAPSTVQRVTTDFKAALNLAAKKHRKRLPTDFQVRIQDGLGTTKSFAPIARHGQALPQEEIDRLIYAAREIDEEEGFEGDLANVTLLKAATGTRFSQLRRITVADLQPHNNRVMVPVSFKGSGEKQQTHVGFPLDNAVLQMLLPLTKGRPGNAPLFERWYHSNKWIDGVRTRVREERGPWRTSSNYSRLWKKIVARAEIIGRSDDVVAYALRHTSIVRLLRENYPVYLVAALHDTSEKSIRQHYAAEIVDALSEVVSTAAMKLGEPKSRPDSPTHTA